MGVFEDKLKVPPIQVVRFTGLPNGIGVKNSTVIQSVNGHAGPYGYTVAHNCPG